MIIIDVEIKKAILGRGEAALEGIEYCGGWRDFAGMGIACVCTYDIVTHLSRVFLEEDFAALRDYLRGKPTAGFNTKRFDLPLLAANGVPCVEMLDTHYDILEQIWLAQGLDPDKFNPRTHGGWGLDAVCQATLGIAKTGHGALAPVWWQQGKRGKVIDYCLNDCHMEGTLLQWILAGGALRNREDGPAVWVKPPQTAPMQGAPMDVNNVVGGPNEPALAVERQQLRDEAERRAAEILNRPAGGLGIIR